MPPEGLTRMPDWLVIGQEEWDQVERRNQLLIRSLARRHPSARFLFAEIPLRAREARGWRSPRPRQVAANIWCMRAVRPFPGRALSHASDRIEAAQLRRALRELGIERPNIWTQDPRAVDLLDELPAAAIVYDLTDDWAAFESDPGRRARVQARIEALGARAQLVLACSRTLAAGARAWSDRIHYLPNAIDPLSDVPAPVPPDIASLPRPRLGYFGTLHSSRLDVELLAELAQLRGSWTFVLLGPNQLETNHSQRLLGLSNVHHLGVRPHAEVRAYLESVDVCLLPHIVTEFTRSLDPLKLYEYLAAGRPVLATPVGNAPELQRFIAEATTAQQLAAEAQRILAVDSAEAVAARRAAVAGETWDARAREVERALGVSPTRSSMPGVCAVVVSHNTRELLECCLTDLRAQAGVDVHTIVVDNASTDASVELVTESFPEVELIELEQNVGFGAANNLAFHRCTREYVLLLNSDAFLAPNALAELVAAAARHPQAAVVGPRLLNPDGTLQRSAWPFPQARRLALEALMLHRPLRGLGLLEDLGTWRHDEELTVDFLIGACLLVRREALAEVGGFDESFWLYGEEAELQRRLATRGWTVVFTPAATATHVGGASSGASIARLRHFYSGQRLFLQKHGAAGSWPLARAALLIGSVLRRRWDAVRVAIERRP